MREGVSRCEESEIEDGGAEVVCRVSIGMKKGVVCSGLMS